LIFLPLDEPFVGSIVKEFLTTSDRRGRDMFSLAAKVRVEGEKTTVQQRCGVQ